MTRCPGSNQSGFISVFAILALTSLVTVVVLILVTGEGQVRRFRAAGGSAKATLVAQDVLSRQMMGERLRQPRWWIPPTMGSEMLPDGTRIRWWRRPVESRWRACARPWSVDDTSRWLRLGADPGRIEFWKTWLDSRAQGRDPILGIRGDLVTDAGFLRGIFRDLGLEDRGLSAEEAWTLDESGSLGRLNLVGADPRILSLLTGIPRERIAEVQASLASGTESPALAAGLWSFMEAQSVEPWAAPRPITEAWWTVEVYLAELKVPIITRWRSSLNDGPPGNPWFRLRPVPLETW